MISLQIFSAPVIQDSEINRKASALFKIIWGVMATITITFVIAIFKQSQYTDRYILIISLTCLISVAFLVFMKTGRIRTSAYFYISFLLAMIFGFSWTGGGIKGHGITLLPAVVLFSGLTIGRKQIWLFGIVASLGGLALVAADYFHILPVTEPLGQTSLIYWIYSNTYIFLFCFLEYLSVGGLDNALNETKQELALRNQSEEKYRLIFESFQDIYYQTDMEGKIMIVTPSIKARAGYDISEVLGRNVTEFYDNAVSRNSFLAEIEKNGSVQNYELDFLSKDGSIINVFVSSRILWGSDGTPKAIEGTIHDVTKRKKAESLLKLQNEKLFEIAFLQSHIVRRPVASIIGLIDLVNKEDPSDPQNFEVIPKLEIASKELDEVIHQIVKKTNEIKPGDTDQDR